MSASRREASQHVIQQEGLKLKEETSKVQHIELGFVWCWNLEISESRSEIGGKFWNAMLEKNGTNQLDRSCEKWSVTYSKGAGANPIAVKRRKTNWIGHILRTNCRLKYSNEGKTGRTRRGGRRKQLLGDIKDKRAYCQLKEEAVDCTMWGTAFGSGCGPPTGQTMQWCKNGE